MGSRDQTLPSTHHTVATQAGVNVACLQSFGAKRALRRCLEESLPIGANSSARVSTRPGQPRGHMPCVAGLIIKLQVTAIQEDAEKAFEMLAGDVSYRFISCDLAFNARHWTELGAKLTQLYDDLDPRTALATDRGTGLLHVENDPLTDAL